MVQITLQRFEKEKKFAALTDAVSYCDICPRMARRKKVLTLANGNIDSKVLFVAEAPGRLGADKTGVPLCGDKAGDNFETLLKNVGWFRDKVFITNAVLCNPRDKKGRNAPPTNEEISNCSEFLSMTIEVIEPDVIVTLGAVALRSLSFIQPHNYSLKSKVGTLVPWFGRKIVPLYHPSQRAVVHRSLAAQRNDFYKLAKVVRPLRGLIARKTRPAKVSDFRPDEKLFGLVQAINFLVSRCRTVSKFKLTKLLYLADFTAYERLKRGITGSIYLRQVDGPWPPDIERVLNYLEGYEVVNTYRRGVPYVTLGPSPRFGISLDEDELNILKDTLERYGVLNNSKIKTATYLTKPMREILKKEAGGENMLNKAVLYLKNK